MSAFINHLDYSQVARGYDRSRRIEPAIIDALVRGLDSLHARNILELGAGTGNYTAALDASGYAVTALDRSSAMVAIGAHKARAAWIVADAGRLPLRANSVDAVAGVNVLHHLPDLAAALAECRRVARAGVVLQAVVRENLATLWYRHYFPEIDEVLLPLHPTLGSLLTTLLRCGFSHVATRKVFYSGDCDLTFEAARARPQLLFDAGFRAATSGFRRLEADGIARGLAHLERDIAAGRFAEIAARYGADHAASGDCVVLTAR
ncbi:MAG: class I SAM-dependent methyltransferase [Candidatus Binatus sp.]|uniref:class I SAM-dependent methyltransferase n=1 Tax=Candidatus Binatus sp. TaxID=2811406 RepID=UPI00271C2BA5|nr:class I SAM-dependent methyltransferase [Candidatus Binatus sp.]MDO8432305.1 class I SAM-dependent methyltransferase [Candidatus Binatus sp.]